MTKSYGEAFKINKEKERNDQDLSKKPQNEPKNMIESFSTFWTDRMFTKLFFRFLFTKSPTG